MRTAQHFDALDFAKVAEADAVAGAEHTVDVDADGALKTKVVAHGADAANTCGCDRLGLGRGDHQPGCDRDQILDILYARILERISVIGADGDRNILCAFLTLLRRNRDDVDRAAITAPDLVKNLSLRSSAQHKSGCGRIKSGARELRHHELVSSLLSVSGLAGDV